MIVVNAPKLDVAPRKADDKLLPPALRVPGRHHAPSRSSTCSRATPRGSCAWRCRACCRRAALGRQMLRKLQVYAGPTHPHAAQQPVAARCAQTARRR